MKRRMLVVGRQEAARALACRASKKRWAGWTHRHMRQALRHGDDGDDVRDRHPLLRLAALYTERRGVSSPTEQEALVRA